MKEELVRALKIYLADTYSVYFKAHGYHWNVEGSDFYEYHQLFSDIYEDVYGSVDTIAEDLRKLQSYAPFKMSRFLELTTVQESEVASDPKAMAADLLAAVEANLVTTMNAFMIANGTANEPGIANDLAERDSMLKKWAWQLRSSLKM
jgi:starvation-inducible DNA-binding protein